jgi:AcrR family transcriptional regulator
MPRKKLDDAETRLLAAGLHLFARHGCEKVNSNRIARRARLAIGTFYAHFPDKYALLREIQLRTLTGIRAARLQAVARAGPDPHGQVEGAIDAAVRFAQRHPAAYRVTFGRERVGASTHGPVVSESTRPIAELLRGLQRAGRLPADLDVDLAARAYQSMEVGTLLWWLEDPRRASPADLVDTLGRLHPAAMAR